MSRKLLFSITTKDCKFDYIRGSGKGGQKKNKTSSAVRCTHKASKAVGYAEDTRSQKTNKQLAFKRMAESKEFNTWLYLETAKLDGTGKRIEQEVQRELISNTKTECLTDGKWRPCGSEA